MSTIDWRNLSFLLLVHLTALGAIIWTFLSGQAFAGWSWLLALVWLTLCNLSVGAGLHRYYAHRTHKASWPVQAFYLLFSTASFQGSALEWSRKHRLHHSFGDTEWDPYGINKGFWWAHIGWVFHRPEQKVTSESAPDLVANPLVTWQNKYYIPTAVFMGLALPTCIASLWGNALGGLILAGFLRLTVQYHQTFCVNSLAHWFGHRPDARSSARDGGVLVAAATFGEGGKHGRHHKKPHDYRIDPDKWGFDPGKWFIWSMERLGLAKNLIRIP